MTATPRAAVLREVRRTECILSVAFFFFFFVEKGGTEKRRRKKSLAGVEIGGVAMLSE